jgi:hypothetical protein
MKYARLEVLIAMAMKTGPSVCRNVTPSVAVSVHQTARLHIPS